MNHTTALSDVSAAAASRAPVGDDHLRCPLSTNSGELFPTDETSGHLCNEVEVEGCPLADLLEERLRFERLLVDMSAAFVELHSHQIDEQIDLSLRQLGEFLNIDRINFAEFSDDKPDMIVTHSYAAPGIPTFLRTVVDDNFAWYAAQIRRGEVISFAHLPDEMPPEAAAERAYCVREGLKSHLAIPLRVNDKLRCVITFGKFHNHRYWPDDLVQRLWLIAQVFANSLARKKSDETTRELQEEVARMGRVTLIGELAATIAHEIKQPLCAIMSNAQAGQRILAAETLDLCELRETLKDIVNDSRRANEVVASVREMLQKRITERSHLQLNELIEEVVDLVQAQLSRNRISLVLDLPKDIPLVIADRVQLRQVILNLAINAIDAMSVPEIESRELCLRTERSRNDRVIVTVHDSGPGIAHDHSEGVFAPFYTTKSAGIGMGLAISRSIIESHEGKIWVDTAVTGGAAIRFSLPIEQEIQL